MTFSSMGGEKHKKQVLALSEQSRCWEEIAWGSLAGKRLRGDPSEPSWELSIFSHFLGFAFSPGLLLPLRLGQETFVSLEDRLPPLLKGQKTSLHLKRRISFALKGINGPYFVLRKGLPWEEEEQAR